MFLNYFNQPTDVWAGSMSTVALTNDNEVLVCGLNNYSQVIFKQIITPNLNIYIISIFNTQGSR